MNMMNCKKKNWLAGACAFAVVAAWGSGVALAEKWHFTSRLDGAQVTPPTTSDSWGLATLEYDDETNLLSVDLYVEGIGLDNDWTAAHIHVGRFGFAGGWNIQLGFLDDWFEDGNGIRRVLTDVPYPEEDEHHLLSDGTFIMIHTVEWPGGEVRGQIIQETRLDVSSLARGKSAYFTAINAIPGERVVFTYSAAGLGDGPEVPGFGGLTLDILNTAKLAGSSIVNGEGTAILKVDVPESAPLLDLYFQAVVKRGVDGDASVKSNTASTTILP